MADLPRARFFGCTQNISKPLSTKSIIRFIVFAESSGEHWVCAIKNLVAYARCRVPGQSVPVSKPHCCSHALVANADSTSTTSRYKDTECKDTECVYQR